MILNEVYFPKFRMGYILIGIYLHRYLINWKQARKKPNRVYFHTFPIWYNEFFKNYSRYIYKNFTYQTRYIYINESGYIFYYCKYTSLGKNSNFSILKNDKSKITPYFYQFCKYISFRKNLNGIYLHGFSQVNIMSEEKSTIL